MHLLILEDDLDLGRALQKSLSAEGFSSEWVRRAAEASRFIDQQNTYDCVLLDLSLPDSTGLELLRRWRQSGLSVPLIVITADSSLDIRLAGLADGSETLDAAAREAGRDPRTIDLELGLYPDDKGRNQVQDEIAALNALGSNHIHVRFTAKTAQGQIDSLKAFMELVA